ncbi:hypothetical protein [Sphingobacterium bambusae]|nr:hypothetical protein [Sphingobacterium bambusae]WPL46855.1 hypothetical protein SCB77_12880 [Sphingobacterium bambusae]
MPKIFKARSSTVRPFAQRPVEKVIVSLTSFPGRINRVWIVIECLLRQTCMPDKIILYLSVEQFPNGLSSVPKNLRKYCQKDMLKIEFVSDDLRSHKKYFYALQQFPEDLIITVDDDIYYPEHVVEELLNLHVRYPEAICSLRAYSVAKLDGELLPYRNWKKVYSFQEPTSDLFHTSGAGTLYKKSFFSDEVFNQNVFKKFCFHADDVWLNIMAQIQGTKTVKSEYFSNLLPISSNSFKLSEGNVADGGNDIQLRSLLQYYNINDDEIFN